MTSKLKVYDLAKECGLTGQVLAQKLRDMGFSQIKSHMTALSEFEALEIRGRMEAYGILKQGSAGPEPDAHGGFKIKRKAKPHEEAQPPASEPAAQPAPEAVHAPPREQEPEQGPPLALPEREPEAIEAEAAIQPLEPAFEDEPIVAERIETEAPDAPELVAEPDPLALEPAPLLKLEGLKLEGVDLEAGVVKPVSPQKKGKVVGFIDPAQFQRLAPKRPESRRLRSADDVAPNVMPTLGRDRAAGHVRADTTRGAFTTQQLREREAGRVQRRKKPGQGPGGGPGSDRSSIGGGRRAFVAPISGSPHSGASVQIQTPITYKKLANTLAVKENEVLKAALRLVGLGVTINSLVDEDTAREIALQFNVELDVTSEVAAETQLIADLGEKRRSVVKEDLLQRPPAVAFLGHVDHGKTTLIDTIRQTKIAAGESGGITQHIGAYQVETRAGHKLTIVDTPGHAAFTAMRARGAKAVDIIVLVVAADDGVMPQTEEALNHAKAAKVPIVVALNKIDKREANIDRVMSQLATLGLTPEPWGGHTAMLPVSGLKGTGVEELLERVCLESEVLELKSHTRGPASGVVLEAEIQQGKGKVAHLLIQDGSLKKGDVILAGEGYGKVRSIHDDRGGELKEAGPSLPVEVTGLSELPSVGDRFYVLESLERAGEVALERARSNRQLSLVERRSISDENVLAAVAAQDRPAINLIIKADVQGSVEVLKQQIGAMLHDEMEVKLVHAGVGQVLESDVDLAITSNARIMAFHTSASSKVRQLAERAEVDIKVYEVIYELLDDIKRLMEGELTPEVREEVTGHAEVRRVFKSSKFGNIAGCFVTDGKILRSNKARILRDGSLVHSGTLASLRREKDDAKEVREGFECGILFKDFNDVHEGDVIEAFRVFEVKRTL